MLGPRPVATYRFQLTPSFTFEDAARQLRRLAALGISHVYLSPVAEAVRGSTHGYDVVDHTRVRDELGGADGLSALLDACATNGIGVLLDHVPNHTAVGRPELNPRWWALLREGPRSDAARWFDVDWDAGDGRVILPVLGAPAGDVLGELQVVDGELRLGTERWPLAPGTEGCAPAEALERQHYRLQWWRDPARNVRRFFTIDDLVAVRVEDPVVAAVVDTLPRLLADHEAFAGVRVDHVDGLADPLGYLEGLRAVIGERWLVVEKILARDEVLPAAWPVDGTTGYEHAAFAEHALLDGAGWEALRARWVAATGDERRFHELELQARREVLATGLRPDVERVARVLPCSPDVVTELTAHLGRYRTYLPDHEGRPALDAAHAAARDSRRDLADALDAFVAALDEHVELRTRWQQLTGPTAAKGVEDRAFWRHLPLASLAEVGGAPEPAPGDAVARLHEHHATTQARWPSTLLAGTTHDTKRSEDVRAAGLALAAVPERFGALLDAWLAGPGAGIPVDPAMHWHALQTAVTTAGIGVDRLGAFLVKAAREAAVHTSWTDPDEAYEGALPVLAAAVLGWAPVRALAAELARSAQAMSLALLAVRLTAPGVPDVYQGTEAFRYLLTDPDNRAEPDHAALDVLVERAAVLDGRAAWAEDGAPAARAVVLRRLLGLRRRVALGGHRPLESSAGLVAFARGDAAGEPLVATVVPRAVTRPGPRSVTLPPGRWRHALVDDVPELSGTITPDLVDDLLAAFPAIVLHRAPHV
jgi:(1->4)-alpha-D-glucan 1-alpha-D-glucosylmutase